jgi:5-methylthioribose kinase
MNLTGVQRATQERPTGKYVQQDVSSVCEYVEALLGEKVRDAKEIGDGNMNLVFRVQTDEKSLIVKQAVPYLRVAGEGWPLTLNRARIEAAALAQQQAVAPGMVPQVHHYDPEQYLIVMEDLREHVLWRQVLCDGVDVDGVAEGVGVFLARSLLGTSDILMNPADRKALIAQFVNPELCAITEDLVFTAPYHDAESNRIDAAAEELAAELRRDRALQMVASQLRWQFRTRGEALLHGDLHTGSVMVAPGDPRVMDPEFAFFGPMGFDIGNVFANLAFARIRHSVLGNPAFTTMVDEYAHNLWFAFTEEVRSLWPANEPWREPFISQVLADSAGYAAMEMIRRMVGLARVIDIDTIPDDLRYQARTRVGQNARLLALGPSVRSFDDLWDRATQGADALHPGNGEIRM